MATITITLRETGQSVTATLKVAAPPPKIKDFIVDEEGYITKVSETNGHNMYRLHTKANWDKGVKNKFITLNEGKVIEELAERKNPYKSDTTYWGIKNGVYITISNKDDAYKLFKFVCDASIEAEWALLNYEKRTTKKSLYVLATLNYSESPGVLPPPENYTDLDLKIHFHSHPGTAKGKDDVASGAGSSRGDVPMAIHYVNLFYKKRIKRMPAFVIYRPHAEKPPYKFQYDAWKNFLYGTKMKIQTYHDLYKNVIPIQY